MKKLLLLALMVVGCGKNPVGPSDTPTPVPTPVPVASSFTIKNGVNASITSISVDGAVVPYTCGAGVYGPPAATVYTSVSIFAYAGTHSVTMQFASPGVGGVYWAFDTSPPSFQTTVSLTVNTSGVSGIQLDYDGNIVTVGVHSNVGGVAYTIY